MLSAQAGRSSSSLVRGHHDRRRSSHTRTTWFTRHREFFGRRTCQPLQGIAMGQPHSLELTCSNRSSFSRRRHRHRHR